MIAHVVLFTPRDGLSDHELRLFAREFQSTCRSIPSIRRAAVGPVATFKSFPEPTIGHKPYAAFACIEFDDTEGLAAYMQHPQHADLARLFWDYCESTMFVDAEVGDPLSQDVQAIFGLNT